MVTKKKRKYTKYRSTRTEKVKLIRRIIKKKCPTVSVRMGTGTAWGWVDIHSRDRGAVFTEKEKKCLRSLGLIPGSNWDTVAPDEQDMFIERQLLKRIKPKW